MSPQTFAEQIGRSSISPYDEMVAYEYLYSLDKSSLKKMTEMTVHAGLLPSQALGQQMTMFEPEGMGVIRDFLEDKLGKFSVAVNNTPSWPDRLKDAEQPSPLFYYEGDISLMEYPSISIVGSRKASEDGLKRARKLARELVASGYAIVSGLAKGIDTAAMTTAIQHGGKVIGVIGTPIDEYYPKENKALQDEVAFNHLLVSQVPFYKYANQPFSTRRFYFPERNELMAAISNATVIVEASDTSGTLTQARACRHQNRPLFILQSCYDNPNVEWPKKWATRENVHIISSTDQILEVLEG